MSPPARRGAWLRRLFSPIRAPCRPSRFAPGPGPRGGNLAPATNTGPTVAIDHLGRVTHALLPRTAGVPEAFVEGRQGLTPYARWISRFGLWPLAAVALAVLAAPWLRGAARRRRAVADD